MPKFKKENPELESALKETPASVAASAVVQEKPIIHRHRRTRVELEAARAKVQSLPEVANPLFIPLIKMPFDIWADNVKLDTLRLSDEEAGRIALPVTQLVNYYLPRIPSIAYAWASLVLAVYGITYPRFSALKKIRAAKKEVLPDGEKSNSGIGSAR